MGNSNRSLGDMFGNTSPDYLRFEFRDLEVALEVVCKFLLVVMELVTELELHEHLLKIFNVQFEELHQRQSQWTAPDTELRESLRLAVVEVLLSAYRSFIKYFGALVENGKNPDKYLRYSTKDLDRMLCEFFEDLVVEFQFFIPGMQQTYKSISLHCRLPVLDPAYRRSSSFAFRTHGGWKSHVKWQFNPHYYTYTTTSLEGLKVSDADLELYLHCMTCSNSPHRIYKFLTLFHGFCILLTRLACLPIVAIYFSHIMVGVAEMKVVIERTGGLVVLAESFGHSIFKDSFRRVFEKGEESLGLSHNGELEINCSKDIKIQGIIGPCTSLEKKGPAVASIVIGQGDTTAWKLMIDAVGEINVFDLMSISALNSTLP
ncbi:unnamed protein product [Lactuca virosa]|uniref:Protein transport protein SEC23 n=1 Tax=Lactuca virosa TaxID=75947 RepID=A0AAU9MJD2_9ASTR|nr:unnamed protein product [Lactuca virosa]